MVKFNYINIFYKLDPLTAKFKIAKSYFCLCHKFVNAYMKIQNGKFYISYDENFKNSFLIISCNDIITVNKRLIFKSDINTLSIYYKDPNSINAVKEIKLKADSRKEASDWVELLRVRLSLNKKFEFQLQKPKEKRIETYLKHLINYNPKNLFFVVNKVDSFLTQRIKFFFLKNFENIILTKEKIKVLNLNIEDSMNGMSIDQPLIKNENSEVEMILRYEMKQQLPILNKMTENILKNSIVNERFILII